MANWREWFRRNSPAIKQEGAEVYSEIKEALVRQQIDGAGAANFDKRAQGAAILLQSLANVPKAMVRLGDVVIAKATIDGEPRVMIETLSPSLTRELDRRPALLADPIAFFEFFDAETKRVATQADALNHPRLKPPDKRLS